jgi:pimeloyl-ACP methyl ester carboxylesterase
MSALAASRLRAAADIAGPPDAPALVFLHAASDTRKMWLPQTVQMQDEFRTVALDLPGHGARAGEKFTFKSAVKVVHEMLAEEQIDRAVLVGVSLGGCVAMDFASQYPGAVSGLVLSGSTFDPCTLLCRLVLTGESLVFPCGASLFTRVMARSLRRRFPSAMAEEMVAAGTYWNAAAEAVLAMRGVDFRAKLGAYPGPTLILNGARDWVHRTAERAFAAAARNARVLPLARAGHIANLDEPDAFTDAVRAFANTTLSR